MTDLARADSKVEQQAHNDSYSPSIVCQSHTEKQSLNNKHNTTESGSSTLHVNTAVHGAVHSVIKHPGTSFAWIIAAMACCWLALCTAVGPLYWANSSIADFSWLNAIYFVLTFVGSMAIIWLLVRFARSASQMNNSVGNQELAPTGMDYASDTPSVNPSVNPSAHASVNSSAQSSLRAGIPAWFTRLRSGATYRFCVRCSVVLNKCIVSCTNSWWKIALILCIGWLWVPATLLTAFGADIRSQAREFSWAWNQWTGRTQPYIGFFSFVPMDIYPTAHYLWPGNPTYLTDQHNIVLTVFYGAATAISRYFSGSNDWGFVVLSWLQFVFAVFCCSATAHRFFNLPWQRRCEKSSKREFVEQSVAHAPFRTVTLLFFLLCPLAVFSTISLTKSPLFAFAFVWWFGVGYELRCTQRSSKSHTAPYELSRRSVGALAASTCVMLISAKYAFYILVVVVALLFISDRKRWKTYAVGIVLPVIVLHGTLMLLTSSGAIINGDPIESRGIQLQQIARVAKLNPNGIPEDARQKLSQVFNLDQMAEAYYPQDADPVKSSGIQSKKVSYRWRSVTAKDMENFNIAWLEIVKANPVIATDAFFAKCYGYFDIADLPYVSMDYYVSNDYVQGSTSWIKYWFTDWRNTAASNAKSWGNIPVLGWVTHGNLYVILTLLVGAAEVILRRWKTLVWHIPMLLLMGVMITSPANNFERHMLPVAFVFAFVALTFYRESRQAKLES